MTYSDISSDARRLLQDIAPYRYTDLEVYGYVTDAVVALFAIRPSAFFVDGRLPSADALEPPTAEEAEAADGNVAVPVSHGNRYRQALMYYVASRCLWRDDSDTQNTALAVTYMQNFASYARM